MEKLIFKIHFKLFKRQKANMKILKITLEIKKITSLGTLIIYLF